jgi:glucose/arabinose dehydrogenase
MVPFYVALTLIILMMVLIPSTFTTAKGTLDRKMAAYLKHSSNPTEMHGEQNSQTGHSKFHVNYITLKTNQSSIHGVLLNNNSQSGAISLDSDLFDKVSTCKMNLTCTMNNSTGWKDNSSVELSTNGTKNNYLKIVGHEVDVKPKERYQIVVHMKLNEWATQSQVRYDGYNETSKKWHDIDQCPSASLNGPLEWQEFSCGIVIDKNITKLRVVLVPGWSIQKNKESTTWFDSIYLIKFKPFLRDGNLTTELITDGLNSPVNMAFLGTNDILVTERNGTVQRIVNGVKSNEPLIKLNVTRDGLLGIAINKTNSANETGVSTNPIYVYLYFGTYKREQGNFTQEKEAAANRLYRYELVNNTLVKPKLLVDVPAGFNHNGGPILIAPDKHSVLVSIGDVEDQNYKVVANKALNNKTGADPDGTAGILRVTANGNSVFEKVFNGSYPLNLYYAYGIRQNFGMDFDPLTGILWDSENGANWGDEINLVEPGFNSGWNKVQGIWKDHVRDNGFNSSEIFYNPVELVDFGGHGKYRSPEFTWKYTVGPTALIFVSTDKLGKEYENDIFVADANNGRIYDFNLNNNRTGFVLDGPLADKIADTDRELDKLIFASDFGTITDLKIGPDGYLYFVVYSEGKIYRIVPQI